MKRVAVVGYGNIGRYAVQAVEAAPDLELAGVVRRQVAGALPPELREVQAVDDIQKLGRVDAALLCVPSRTVPDKAREVLELGINTVDSFDIHGEDLLRYRKEIDITAKEHGAVAVIAAGWDPGTDSVVRALLELMAPKGITFTNLSSPASPSASMARCGAKRAAVCSVASSAAAG